ncbi:MAG: bifunctional 2-keto-4-hydroxyglutarate aldolase/2-keto-3-deoxy-6-phosphogluconate aldolase [Streptococcaceae bacterium]|jgi:2-dehydro-3-deoxyphosphogluconate aldolase/(4S)-4-hydroxy-2-oxoglutarate aldolase|nr:bifunctional 2-keto-4-hydroxyglutarate aldolase/2-keto-3-deoxy-6-phosphogluconate aldolase [Streptococcaceae bacterium]
MKKVETILKLKAAGVIVVVRADSAKDAILASESLIEGGLRGIEIAFTTPNAIQAITHLAQKYKDDPEVVIGAGTVLDESSVVAAIQAGSSFVVSPCFNKESAKVCNLYQIPYLPGCLTPTEIREALVYGADIIKLFPGSAFSPNYISNIKAPLPQVNIMPTGGVNLENMHEWFESGVFAVGIGGDLMKPLAKRDFEGIKEKAKKYKEKLMQIQSQN